MPEGLNFRIIFAISAGAIGSSFQHGYNTGVLNAPQKLIESWIKNCPEGDGIGGNSTSDGIESKCMDDTTVTLIWSWVVAIFCIGGMMGGSMVGFISSWLGRKGGLLLNNILVVIAALLMGLSKMTGSFQMLIAGRLIIGINSGLNAGLAPMYLSEIAPVSMRGAVGTVYQLIITISILLSQILGMSNVLGTETGWPLLLALTIVPAIFQVLTLPFCPESPKFLLLDKDDEMAANKALTWLRSTIEVHDEMDEMKQEQEAMKLVPKVTLKEMLTNSALRKPLIIANMMMLAQQLSGINAAIFFSTKIFESAGLDEQASQSATLGMGAMNVAMTFVSLIMIEKAGRKTLMISGLVGMFFMTTLLLVSLLLAESLPWISYMAIVAVILFVVGFATGPGSIPWFFVTELFSQSGRPIASSIAVAVNWSANFLVGLGFSPIQLAVGPYVFIIFMVTQLIFIAYVWFVVPETKNRTII
ncbi:solute carrier family 2, facilitated glucose transporter member 1 [Eurytemora carolleeae]|uniref:solute carrier family 2, facilitated glucose transporter member 1 n=1 Tax=Eurytemora carolleeae TaxID=1294199 RepID=UPI000C75A87C|nr:solute carrier family 2, facilitated glucose transporter member 1 [Eurytemora carolleeae]|eukprot:XP_023319897.1 solute carrier family 2, facilitated glucose transporter member 1-like [Eurytemora affinis]